MKFRVGVICLKWWECQSVTFVGNPKLLKVGSQTNYVNVYVKQLYILRVCLYGTQVYFIKPFHYFTSLIVNMYVVPVIL